MTDSNKASGSLGVQLRPYQCHKTVHAGKIASISIAFDTVEMMIDGYGLITQSSEWFNKHQPHKGGYLVYYEDGYCAFSPAAAFESGYVPADRLDRNQAARLLRVGQDIINRAVNALINPRLPDEVLHHPNMAQRMAEAGKMAEDRALIPQTPPPV